MMLFEGAQLRAEFEQAFGKSIDEMTTDEARWLVKFAKHCRGRCRSNVALYNYLNRNLTGLRFKEVPIEGKDYKGLSIQPKVGVAVVLGEE